VIRLDRQQVVIAAVAAAMVMGFGVLGYWPLLREARAVSAAVDRQREYLRKTDDLVRRLVVLHRRLDGLEAVGERFDRRVPAEAGRISELWSRLADEMKTHGLRDQLIRPGVLTEGERLVRNTISLECSGSLQQTFDFLRALDASDRLIRVERLTLSNGEGHSGILKLVADARVYGQPKGEKGT